MRARAGRLVAAAAAMAVGFGGAGVAGVGAGTAVAAQAGPAAVKPLPPELEKIRAAEAVKLYGDAAERPVGQRKTSLISLGDSEIAGRASVRTSRGRTGRTTGATVRPRPPSTAPGYRRR